MMTMLKTVLIGTLWLLMALPALAEDPASDPAQDTVQKEPQVLSMDPVVYTQEYGFFQITFPGGCGKLVTRANEPDLYAGEDWEDIIQVTFVYCDRNQIKGEGCSVNATYNMPSDEGSLAGPQQVIKLVEEALAGFGAKVTNQHPIKKIFENGVVVEGVELFAQPEEGHGEVWIRGLLTDGDIYILTAWNNEGAVWNNPDYSAFFSSFKPWVD